MAKEYLATYRSLMSGAAARPRLVAVQGGHGGHMEGAAQ
jgi:hypothetical protein